MREVVIRFGLALACLLAASGAGAACPEPCKDGQPCAADGGAAPADGCSEAAPAALAGAAPLSGTAATTATAAREAEGRRELALAEEQLAAAERATTDEGRKAAYRASKEHAERAIELLPNDANARFTHFAAAGRLAQLQGLATAALQLMSLNAELDEVLRLDPNHANALAARGGMLVKLPRLLGGDTKKGVAYLERAVTLDDTAIGKRLELAEAYHLVGRGDDATRTANDALALAQQVGDAPKVETCKRFIAELQSTCAGCAIASIGR